MCGRDTFFATWAEVRQFSSPLKLETPAEDPEPTWNRAPTQTGWVIVASDEGGKAVPMRWGLIPFWAKDIKIAYSTINARVETVDTKPAFRAAYKHRRCLVPASGYYEWKALDGKNKQPYFIHPAEAPVMFFAGLWERWQPKDGDEVLSYSILTQDAEGELAQIHDRQPVILPGDLLGDWLHCAASDMAALLHSLPAPTLSFHPVAYAVGNPRNQGAQLVAEI